MTSRGYKTMNSVWEKIISVIDTDFNILPIEELFPNWHNERYYKQCYYNLEEKFDCGGLSNSEWEKIRNNKIIN